MSVHKPKVVITRKLPDAVEQRMGQLFDAEFNLADLPMGPEALKACSPQPSRIESTPTSWTMPDRN
jgi:glyoxylate reductase